MNYGISQKFRKAVTQKFKSDNVQLKQMGKNYDGNDWKISFYFKGK